MKAYLAGGCFWCMAKPYNTVEGVTNVVSGYCGGTEVNPSYEDVKHQLTTHRETVLVEFDENIVSFKELLDVYFYNIDPFDGDGQFIDRGHSYTCCIYYLDEDQKNISLKYISDIEAKYGKKVCVDVEEFKVFYDAEEYHQDYALKNKELYEEEFISSGRASRSDSVKVKL